MRPSHSTASQKRRLSSRIARGDVPARPVPRRGRLDRAGLVGDEQHAAGRVDDVGEGLDDALAERRRRRPRAADGVGEAQPFGAIIVAMLEQMLGELDLGPAARAGRRERVPSPRRSSPRAPRSPPNATNPSRCRAARWRGSSSPRNSRRWRAATKTGRSPRATGGCASLPRAARRGRTAARSARPPRRASRTGPRSSSRSR